MRASLLLLPSSPYLPNPLTFNPNSSSSTSSSSHVHLLHSSPTQTSLTYPSLLSLKPSLKTHIRNDFKVSATYLTYPSLQSLKPSVKPHLRNDFRVRADDDNDIIADDYEMDDDLMNEMDNKTDYDVEYENLLVSRAFAEGDVKYDIEMTDSKSFVSTQGWDPEKVVDYRINEDEFHKISLLECDFFIRKPNDPDDDVFDFREMYVTPPDTDVYSVPTVLAPMPQKHIRCAKSDYGWYNVTEPPINALRDPMCKSEWEVSKVFLTKHYRNRRHGDPEFVLDFEEIYVIDSKTKSITRAKVLVTAPGGRDRDRKNDVLIIRENANSFKIIHKSERYDPTTVIEREEWAKSRQDMEKHLRKLRDYDESNWF